MSDSFKIAVKRAFWVHPGLDFYEEIKRYVYVTCAWRHAIFVEADEADEELGPPELVVTKDSENVYFHFCTPSLRGLPAEQVVSVRRDVAWFIRGRLVRYVERCVGASYHYLADRLRDAVTVCDE